MLGGFCRCMVECKEAACVSFYCIWCECLFGGLSMMEREEV